MKVLEGENMLVELPLYGEFEKFNSNTGWSSGVGLLPSAFSHWTWVQSNGEHLICDLQGHKGLKGGPVKLDGKDCPYYAFSDPVVLSKVSGTYGPADLGVKGQETWFSKHVCNDLCKSLALEGKVPNWRSHFKAQTHTVYRPIRQQGLSSPTVVAMPIQVCLITATPACEHEWTKEKGFLCLYDCMFLNDSLCL